MFDPKTVGRGRKHRVTDLPAGAARLVRDGVGFTVFGSTVRAWSMKTALSSLRLAGHVLRDFAS